MQRYATITPKEGAAPPAHTRRGWAFPYNSEWHEISAGKAFPEELAEHARSYFTIKPQDGGEPICSVEIEYFEGELELRPVELLQPVEHTCPVCNKAKFTDVSELSNHVKECAVASAKKTEKKEGE